MCEEKIGTCVVGGMILKKLSEMSKQEIKEIKKKQFLAVPVSDIKDYDYAIPVSLNFVQLQAYGMKH